MNISHVPSIALELWLHKTEKVLDFLSVCSDLLHSIIHSNHTRSWHNRAPKENTARAKAGRAWPRAYEPPELLWRPESRVCFFLIVVERPCSVLNEGQDVI